MKKCIYNSASLFQSVFYLIVPAILMSGCDTTAKETKAEDKIAAVSGAVESRTNFAKINGKKIAYRSIGQGDPIILCNRFRGTLDDWDPQFLDLLAQQYQVITFDYSGIGSSIRETPIDSLEEPQDILDLTTFLKLNKFKILGWSHGGRVAQTFVTQHPEFITHLILIGTGPLGKNSFEPEKIFFERALKPINDLDDEVILFFEPKYEVSIQAARLTNERIAKRAKDQDKRVTPDQFQLYFNSVPIWNKDENGREKLSTLEIPMLVISGDHDVVFPIENWYALTRKYPTMQIVMLPKSGHGPQHQYPQLSVNYITNFIANTP